MSYVLGTDIGGTFTDTFATDDSGRVYAAKSPSTPPDFEHRYTGRGNDYVKSMSRTNNPAPLVPWSQIQEVTERIDQGGAVVVPLNEDEARVHRQPGRRGRRGVRLLAALVLPQPSLRAATARADP